MKTYVYLVSYSTGAYDDWTPIHIFVTIDHEKAVKYRDKFNRILHELQEHCLKTEKGNFRLMDTNDCYIDKIEIR